MAKGGPKKRKRTRPVHDRQRRKQLVKEVQGHFGVASSENSEDAWEAWEHDDSAMPRRRGMASPTTPPVVGGDAAPDPATDPSTAADGPEGRIVSLESGLCGVETGSGADREWIEAVLPSRLAADQRSKVAVGDRVQLEIHHEGYRVAAVQPRRSILARPDPHNPRRQRVIAANVDVVVVVAALVDPPLRPALVDRFLIAIDRGGATPLLVVNKVDLVTDPAELEERLAVLAPHRAHGLDVIVASVPQGRGLDPLRQALAGKTAAFVGHSGVGKSSLVNALQPGLDLATAAVSGGGTGRHTTTGSCLYHLDGDIDLIDTPGIREFGLWRLDADELPDYFPDFSTADPCHFANCSHTHEPHCGVQAAVDDGRIPRHRYDTYRRILASLEG